MYNKIINILNEYKHKENKPILYFECEYNIAEQVAEHYSYKGIQVVYNPLTNNIGITVDTKEIDK